MAMPNKTLERTVNHRGRIVLAMDCVLADAQWRSCPAAELNRLGHTEGSNMSDSRVATQPERSYVLGHSDRELARLQVQARLIGPITRGFMRDSGIAPGMRVLDVGSGAGDVAFIAAEIVGESGEIVGVDRDAAAIAAARQRAIAVAASNVTVLHGNPAEMTFDGQFDAVVGRYVLMFQDDPAAMLRKLATHVHAGGVAGFHEPDRDGIRSYPPVQVYERWCQLVDETFRRWGGDPRMGIKLYSPFIAAGLPARP